MSAIRGPPHIFIIIAILVVSATAHADKAYVLNTDSDTADPNFLFQLYLIDFDEDPAAITPVGDEIATEFPATIDLCMHEGKLLGVTLNQPSGNASQKGNIRLLQFDLTDGSIAAAVTVTRNSSAYTTTEAEGLASVDGRLLVSFNDEDDHPVRSEFLGEITPVFTDGILQSADLQAGNLADLSDIANGDMDSLTTDSAGRLATHCRLPGSEGHNRLFEIVSPFSSPTFVAEGAFNYPTHDPSALAFVGDTMYAIHVRVVSSVEITDRILKVDANIDTGNDNPSVLDTFDFEGFQFDCIEGIPPVDCNDFGGEDLLDIANGDSGDVNFNGIPDGCESCPEDCVPQHDDGTTGDLQVSIADIIGVLTTFTLTGDYPCDIAPPPDGDGTVSIADVVAIVTAFGITTTCPQEQFGEPLMVVQVMDFGNGYPDENGDIQEFDAEVSAAWATFSANYDVYRVHVILENETDTLESVSGDDVREWALVIDVKGGTIYNNGQGSNLPPSTYLFENHPNVAFDTFYTIGSATSGSGISTVGTINLTGDVISENVGWYKLGGVEPVACGTGCWRVLVAQIAVTKGAIVEGGARLVGEGIDEYAGFTTDE